MAIQLGRAIGLQGGIPQSNIPQMIQKIGQDISSGIEKVAEKKEAKAAQEQKLKDAILSNVDFGGGIDGSPEDMKYIDEKSKAYTVEMISEGVKKDKTPTQLAALYKDRKNELDIMKRQAEKDWKAHREGLNPEMRGTYHVDEYDRLIEGSPTREVEETIPVDPSDIRIAQVDIERKRKADLEGVENEDAINDINAKYDAEMSNLQTPKMQRRTIEGQKPYFATDPLTRYKSGQDLNTVLQKSKIQKSVGVLPAMVDYQNNFKPESLINVHRDKKGVIVATPDLKKIENARAKYVLSMTYQGSYGKDHDTEKRALAHAAMKQMESDNVPEKDRPARFKEYVEYIAGDDFDKMMETTINEETRKTNEARLLKESGSGSGAGSTQPKMAKLEGTPDVPAIEKLKQDKIAAQQTKIDEYQNKINQYKRQADEASKKGDNDAAKRANNLLASAQKTLAAIEKSKEMLESHKPNTSDVYVFSDKEESVDQALNFVGEGGLTIKAQPTTIFKMNGVTYIGGVVAEDGGFRDVYVPYDKNNKGILGVNKEKLVAEFDKRGFKTIEDEAASKKSGGTATAPKGETKNVLDKIKAKSTKPIAEYQVNKKGTKAKVKYSDGTEQVIDL